MHQHRLNSGGFFFLLDFSKWLKWKLTTKRSVNYSEIRGHVLCKEVDLFLCNTKSQIPSNQVSQNPKLPLPRNTASDKWENVFLCVYPLSHGNITKLVCGFVILTLVAWWMEGDKARGDNGRQLCYHGDCLCWFPWRRLVPSPLSSFPQKCPHAAADNKPSYGSEWQKKRRYWKTHT